jgi:hypothetical protein
MNESNMTKDPPTTAIDNLSDILENSLTLKPIDKPIPLPPQIEENITIEMLKIYQVIPSCSKSPDYSHTLSLALSPYRRKPA